MIFTPKKPILSYAARSNDEQVLFNSASGGMFTELARIIFKDNGIVIGAGWNHETFCAEHKCARNESELDELRGSKYTASDLSKVYDIIQNALKNNIKVLFTGTPCQIAAMRNRFGDDKNLILCGIMCHSVTELYIWKKYIAELETKSGSKIKSIKFRDKRNGWKKGTFCVEFADPSKNIAEYVYGNAYVKSFLRGYSARRSCLNCQFRSGRCNADLIIGDFWGIEKYLPELDVKKGISAVLIFTEVGKTIFNQLDIFKKQMDYQQILEKNPCLEKSITPNNEQRNRFLQACKKYSIENAVKYAKYELFPFNILRFINRVLNKINNKIKSYTD